MHVLVTDIVWDTDDHPVEECGVPTAVLFLDVPNSGKAEDGDLLFDTHDRISCMLSDVFGFCHSGYCAANFDRASTDYYERMGVVFYEE